MIAALAAIEYLGRITDKFFEAQMKRAAVRIKVPAAVIVASVLTTEVLKHLLSAPRPGSRSVRSTFPMSRVLRVSSLG